MAVRQMHTPELTQHSERGPLCPRVPLILQSDPVAASGPDAVLITDTKRIGADFTFKFNGTIGQTYQFQTSTNLVHWSNLTTLACTNATTSCTIPGQNGPRQFYRLQKL